MMPPAVRKDRPWIAAACLLICACASPIRGVENWPAYRGPTGQGRADESRLPIVWSTTQNVAWRTPVPGKAWSTPVIWGDRVFLTNAAPEGSRLSVVCIDKNSGKVQYRKRLHTVPLPQYCHPFNSYGSPSPVYENGKLYVSFGSPYNACLDARNGKVIWQRTDFVCNHFRGPGSSPMIYRNLLILHFDGSDRQYVVAMDKATGKTVWRTDRTVDYDDLDPKTGKPDRQGDWRKAYSTPLVIEAGGRPVLVSLGSMALYGYAPETGKELWRLDATGSHSGAVRPVYGEGMLIAQLGSKAELWGIRPATDGTISEQQVVWKHKKTAVPRRASPLLVDGLLYMVSDAGVAGCLEARTGKVVWVKRLGGNFSASPIYASGRIYFFDQDGKATVIRAGREYKLLATNSLSDGFMASPAVSGNALFLRSRSALFRIEAAGSE